MRGCRTLFIRGHVPHGLVILVNPGKTNMGRAETLGVGENLGNRVIFGKTVGIDVDFRLRVLAGRICEIGVHRRPVDLGAVPADGAVKVHTQFHGLRNNGRRRGIGGGHVQLHRMGLNRQGNDRGLSYRSAIFYVGDEQKRIAEDTIEDVNASGLWPGKVVTELEPAGDFWEAEPEHQDYLERYPDGYTCHFIRPEWKLPIRAAAKQA